MSTTLQATVVVDNISQEGLEGEWGLCIDIRYQGHHILLDSGASDLFVKNAEKLGIDLADVEYAVLSHAHYDHANGMEAFFKQNEKASFYLRDGSGENCYGKILIFHRYIGLPKGILTRYSNRIVFAEGDYLLCEGVSLIPHKSGDLSAIGRRNHMYRREGSIWKPDDFAHEQSLVFETPSGLVVFNSCSHGGADTIIEEVSRTYPNQPICALIGGFHIFDKPEAEVRDLGQRIKQTGIQQIYTGHCTGERSFQILRQELGESAACQLHTGLVMEF